MKFTHIMDERLKKAVEDVDREKALKDVLATAKDKGEAATATEKRVADSEKAWALVEQRLAELDVKLAKAKSLNLSQVDEIEDLKATL